MSYRWVDHTAEVELEIEAADEREVLEDAVRALAELLGTAGSDGLGGRRGGPEGSDGPEVRSVVAEAPDRPALLAAWIEELAFLAESEGFVAKGIESLSLSDGGVSATVRGVLDEPPPLVKAVTYHRLAFERSGDGYLARVVLDV